MTRSPQATKGAVGVACALIGGTVQIAYQPDKHPLVVAIARWLFWGGIVLLVWWVRGLLVDKIQQRRRPKPESAHGSARVTARVSMSAEGFARFNPKLVWHAGCSTAGGEVLPSMEGLMIFLNHAGAFPSGIYLCDLMIDGKRSRCLRETQDGVSGVQVIYPREFTGETEALPLHPGTHHAAWRSVHGATTDFLVGLEIEVPSSGSVRWQELRQDPLVTKG
jgi:hypothetical protein